MKLKLLNIISATVIVGCASTNITYNPKEFDTVNYQKNVENAVDAADTLKDFDQTNVPRATLEPGDFSSLVQADIFFNQGDYLHAYPYYKQLAFKYKDPRITYKAIICLEHFSATKEQIAELDTMVNLFIKVSPNSQLAKLFQIKVALTSNDLDLAKNDLDTLMGNNPDNGRATLLFISSLLTGNLQGATNKTLTDFGDYVRKKYKAYPESNLVASINYASANSPEKLKKELEFIQNKFPNWNIPAIWSVAILSRVGNESEVISILRDNLQNNKSPDIALQNIYVSTLVKTNQLDLAQAYSQDSIKKNQNPDNALVNLGVIKIIKSDYNNAITDLGSVNIEDKALASVVKLTMASIYDYNGQTNEAIKYYQQASELNPLLMAPANLMLLNDYAALGDKIRANQLVDNIAKNNKLDEKQTILLKAQYYIDVNWFDDAYKLLGSHFKQYSSDKNYLYMYAAMSAMTKNTKDAIKLYKQYIKLDPKNVFGYNDLAFVYADQTHDYKSAYKYASKALELNPTDPNVLDTVGWVYYRQHNYSLALQYVKNSLDKSYSADSAKHLKAIYQAMGQNDQAQKVVILDKNQLQTNLKRQLLNKAAALLIYVQLGLEVKQSQAN